MTEDGADLSLLEQVLEGRSDGFKAKVLDLVVRYRWDVDDPNFLILVATGQMETLLEAFPEQFDQMFEQAFRRLEQQQSNLTGVIQGVEMTSAARTAALAEQVVTLERMLLAERQRVFNDIQRLLKVSEREKGKMMAELSQRVKQLSGESHQVTERMAFQLIEAMGKGVRRRYYLESVAWVSLSTLLILVMGVGLGWMMRDRDFQTYRNSSNVWFGLKLVEWNLRELRECQKLKQPTCNVYIEKPEESQR